MSGNSWRLDCDEQVFPDASALENALDGFVETDVPLTIEVLFVDEEEIRRLNRDMRSIDKVTDVLSFPALDLERGQAIKRAEYPFEIDEEGRLLVGSIAICIKRAREQAEEYGHSYERELHYLMVHGIMHCLGYDHMEERDKAQMREQEEKILNKLAITR